MKQIKGSIMTVLAAVGFGFQPLLARYVFSFGVGDTVLAFLRAACMVPVFACIVWVKKDEGFHICGKTAVKVFVLALTGSVLTSILLLSAYQRIDTGTATTLNFTYPVFVLVFGSLIYREPITKQTAICFVFCMAGIVLFCNPNGYFTWKGFFLALCSGVTYGIYVLYLDKCRVLEELGFFTYTFYFFLFSAVMLLPVMLLSGRTVLRFSAAAWVWIAAFVIDGGIIATLFLQSGIKEIGSQRASLLSTLEPVTSILLGWVFLRETVLISSIIGILLILLSNVLLIVVPNRKSPPGDL